MTNIITDEQIDELWDEIGGYYNLYPEVRNTVREALRRWGNVEELKEQIKYLEWRAYGEE
jgi:hypothetical protein